MSPLRKQSLPPPKTVAQQVSQLHGLVNNAGIGVGGPLEFLPRPSCAASWKLTSSAKLR
jgi:hypothetical protein